MFADVKDSSRSAVPGDVECIGLLFKEVASRLANLGSSRASRPRSGVSSNVEALGGSSQVHSGRKSLTFDPLIFDSRSTRQFPERRDHLSNINT